MDIDTMFDIVFGVFLGGTFCAIVYGFYALGSI